MTNLSLFSDDELAGKDEIIHHDDSIYQARLDGQWLSTVVLREGFTIARRKLTSYAETLALANKLDEKIFGRREMLFQPEESEGVKKHREKARLLSKKKKSELLTSSTKDQKPFQEEDALVTALQAVDLDINDLKELLKSDTNHNPYLRAELSNLEGIRKELEQQEIGSYDETAIILKDWNRGINLPTFIQPQRSNYHDFALPGNRVMRIGFFHPQKAEFITGADLLYEYHDLTQQRVRLVAIQYKIPKEGRKSITIDGEIQKQLNRLNSAFCCNQLCEGPWEKSSTMKHPFSFPCCCAFFRPTDRLQQFNTHLATSGYHVRVCDIDNICENSSIGNKLLTLEASKKNGISANIFEELFYTGRLGSRWLTYEQLEKFHHEYRIIQPHEHATINIFETFISENTAQIVN